MKWLRPLRLVWGLALLVAGGFLLRFLTQWGPEVGGSSFQVGKWLRDSLPPTLAIGMVHALAVGGGSGLRAGAQFLVGLDERADLIRARDTLAAAARGVLWAALLTFLFYLAAILYRAAHPAAFPGLSPGADFRMHALGAPVSALILGRLFLVPLAERASDLAGETGWQARSVEGWLPLALFLCPLAFCLTLMIRYGTI